MKYITANKDLGKKETFDTWNGKFLDESSYDEVVKVTLSVSVLVKRELIALKPRLQLKNCLLSLLS